MDEMILSAILAGDLSSLTQEQKDRLLLEVVPEFIRLREWCAVCLGEDVAKFRGIEV